MLNTPHPALSRPAPPTGPAGRWQRLAGGSPFTLALLIPLDNVCRGPAGLAVALPGHLLAAAPAHPSLPLPQQTPDPAAVRGAWKAPTRFRNR